MWKCGLFMERCYHLCTRNFAFSGETLLYFSPPLETVLYQKTCVLRMHRFPRDPESFPSVIILLLHIFTLHYCGDVTRTLETLRIASKFGKPISIPNLNFTWTRPGHSPRIGLRMIHDVWKNDSVMPVSSHWGTSLPISIFIIVCGLFLSLTPLYLGEEQEL